MRAAGKGAQGSLHWGPSRGGRRDSQPARVETTPTLATPLSPAHREASSFLPHTRP